MARARKSVTAQYEAPDGTRWKVNRMDLLAAELQVAEDRMPLFHAAASRFDMGWMICRRLFGIVPVAASMSDHADNLRTWDRPELCAALGRTPAGLAEELERIAGLWQAAQRGEHSDTAPALEEVAEVVDVDKLIAEHGFTDMWSNDVERDWFRGRVQNYAKMLVHSMAGPAVRGIILNELELRRIQVRRSRLSRELATEENSVKRESSSKEHASVNKQQNELEAVYREQQEQLDKMFPWMGQVKDGVTFRAIISELVRGHQLHYSRKDNRLIDGINGLGEVQILMRKSEQDPNVQYRAGLVTYLNMARGFTWDSNWACQFPDSVFKRLDAGFKEAEARVSEALNERLPDLSSDDPVRGEFSPIQIPDEIPAT